MSTGIRLMLGCQRYPKLLVALVLTVALIMSASAQETRWKQLKDKAQLLYQQGKYSEGLTVAKEDLHVANLADVLLLRIVPEWRQAGS